MTQPLPKDPQQWPTERKLAYAMERAEKLIDRLPLLAETWLREADRLRDKLAQESSKILVDDAEKPANLTP